MLCLRKAPHKAASNFVSCVVLVNGPSKVQNVRSIHGEMYNFPASNFVRSHRKSNLTKGMKFSMGCQVYGIHQLKAQE